MTINNPKSTVFKHKKISVERIEKYISDTYFTDANIYGRLHPEINKSAVTLKVTEKTDRITYDEAMKLDFKDCKIGDSFGPSWVTFWFKVHIEVPEDWKNKKVHFIWNSSCEGLIWMNGKPIQGLTGGTWVDKRETYTLLENSKGGEVFDFELEIGCNGMFGVGRDGLINACDEKKTFSLTRAEIGIFDPVANELYTYLTMLYDIAKNFPEDSVRGAQALWTANDMINTVIINDEKTYHLANNIAKQFFSQKNGDSQSTVYAIGHAHIDLAWLWPYAETKRKCARSFATQTLYMESYPEYKFVQSQTQAYIWTKELYPDIYKKIKEMHKRGQWVVTGGTHVEFDANLPSGESFIRQFLHGQRFLKSEFGEQAKVFWLPDTFGYSAQLPQVINHMGIKYFMTQKLSWNNINKFPHNTFIWEGIDGSQVLTHFPPANTYNSAADVKEVVESVTNNKDVERCGSSMLVYGHGDGGGGPNIPMIERLQIMKDTDGIPKVTLSPPQKFFEDIEPSRPNLLTWIGELYFELHRGTYTSQAATKKGNRFCERELHSIELLLCLCDTYYGSNKYSEAKSTLHELWELVLLNQFHDVLPGSSIEMVYKDSFDHHSLVLSKVKQLIEDTLQFIVKNISNSNDEKQYSLLFNSNDFEITRVIQNPRDNSLGTVTIKPNSIYLLNLTEQGVWSSSPKVPVILKESESDINITNEFIKLVINKKSGGITNLVILENGRELIKSNEEANQFVIYEDIPLFWDAWDIEIYTQEKPLCKLVLKSQPKIIENGPLRCIIQLEFKSTLNDKCVIQQTVTVNHYSSRIDFDTQVEWTESHKILRVEFPTNLRTPSATYEIQFGHIQRPTHFNSSWDVAKFEVCGHKWADLSEFGAGLSLLNDCKYGYGIHNGRMNLSLLRAPKAPDANCDMGTHKFTYSLFPHTKSIQESGVIQQGYHLNSNFYQSQPFSLSKESQSFDNKSYITSNAPAVVCETIKKAEDSNDIIVRVYESFGSNTQFKFESAKEFSKIVECNGLEEPIGNISDVNSSFSISPFQIKTFKFMN